MPSSKAEMQIEDHVVRARSACWIRTVDNLVIDLSRYPKIGIVQDSDEQEDPLWAVVAFQSIDDNTKFEILFENEFEEAVKEYFNNVVQILQNPQTIH